jgi:copper(I)-binding protein
MKFVHKRFSRLSFPYEGKVVGEADRMGSLRENNVMSRLTASRSIAWALNIGVFVHAAAAFEATAATGKGIVLAAEQTKAAVKVGSLLIEVPWMRATPPGASVAGGYVRITNQGKEADRFLGGEAQFADHVEIHQMRMVDNVMEMRQLTDGVEIKPGETVELRPGAFHLMFVGIKAPLKQGAHVKVTLAFEKAGKIDVDFDVVGIGAGPPQERAPQESH